MTKRELLVVDDEPQLCRALAAFFTERGFRVTTVLSARDAMEQIRRTKADVVLLDLKLPDSSGLDVLSMLKAQSPRSRVVVISGMTDQETIEEAIRRGAHEYLAKPFDFTRCFFAAMNIEPVELAAAQPDPQALARVPATVAQRYLVLPLRWADNVLELAMADPLDVQRLDELKTLLDCEIKPMAAIDADPNFLTAIQRCYGVGAEVLERTDGAGPAHAAPRGAAAPGRDAEDASGIIRLVNELVQHAHANRATDLHLGIGPEGPWIRERVDGILYDVPAAPQFAELYASVVSRLKVMANLDIAEHRLPQDGRIWFDLGTTQLDLRVSVLPTLHGEHLAIRMLEPSRILHLEQLGMTEEQLQELEAILTKPTGFLLVTGPTGSGKSTSLYAFLSKLNTGQVNIVTIEDPVEHELSGMTQIQVHPKVGLTFADGLRSVLRHDPDLIMVGEVRDQDTANLAVRSALTGHLVLSTLHTNDAASGVTRLQDLGIEPFLLCSTLSGILSQRLVRRLCTHCREEVAVESANPVQLGITVPVQDGVARVFRARGCKPCRHTGYLGRTGIFELLTVDHRIRSLIIKRTPSVQIRQSAIANGMLSLTQSGWQKVQVGVTSLEEFARVLPPELR